MPGKPYLFKKEFNLVALLLNLPGNDFPRHQKISEQRKKNLQYASLKARRRQVKNEGVEQISTRKREYRIMFELECILRAVEGNVS